MARVTVVMAFRNAETTLPAAVRSVLRQSLTDLQLLAVDDGSTDGSRRIVEQFAHDDRRVRLLGRAQTHGSGSARNWAVEESDSQFVAVQDADDLSTPERIAAQVEAFDRIKTVDVIASQIAEFGPWGGPVVGSWPSSPEEIAALQRNYRMPLPHPSTMFRREVLRDAGGYDESCLRAQDFALFLRLRDARLACLPQVHVFYRTERPVPLAYALRSGRYGRLARRRFEQYRRGEPASVWQELPDLSLQTDVRSAAGWVKRRVVESRPRGQTDTALEAQLRRLL